MEINQQELVNIIWEIDQNIKNQQEHLTELDTKIGDGDHGFNLVRGFEKVVKAISPTQTISEILDTVGKQLLSHVGGASGPLYGMGFISGARAVKNETSLNWNGFQMFVNGFVTSVQRLGKAEVGDKTMIDVWIPFNQKIATIKTLTPEIKNELLNDLDHWAEKTTCLISKKGRSSYLKARSQGTMDSGACSSAVIIKVFLKYF